MIAPMSVEVLAGSPCRSALASSVTRSTSPSYTDSCAYTRSTLKHYPALKRAPVLVLDGTRDERFMDLAKQYLGSTA